MLSWTEGRRNFHIKDYLLITFVFLLLSGILFYKTGIKVVTDSPRYIEYASNLKYGFYVDPHNFWYIGYAFFVFAIRLISEDFLVLIVAQHVVSLIGLLFLFNASFLLYKDKRCAYVTTLVYLVFIDISTWNSYVLAESIYVSCICITSYLVIRFLSTNEKRQLLQGAVVPVLLYTSLIKPTGVALLGAAYVLITICLWGRMHTKSSRAFLALVLLLPFTLLVNRMLSTYLIIENYQLGEVIYAAREVVGFPGVSWFIFDPPTDLFIPSKELPQLLRVCVFIIANPLYWLKLFLTKIFFLIFHIRPFWSINHNLMSILILVPSYFFSVRGFFQIDEKQIQIFFLVFLIIQILSIGITSEDWDGRFLMPLLPVVFLFTGKGVVLQLESYLQRTNRATRL